MTSVGGARRRNTLCLLLQLIIIMYLPAAAARRRHRHTALLSKRVPPGLRELAPGKVATFPEHLSRFVASDRRNLLGAVEWSRQ